MSFNSFEEIRESSIKIFDAINNDYLAHISNTKKNETLKEHSHLVSDYLLKISKCQNIEFIVERAVTLLLNSLKISGEKERNYCKAVFLDSIILHDLGKINPNFQVSRMNNTVFKSCELSQKHYHSFLGSFIFSNYYFDKIIQDESINEDHKNFLYFYVLLMSASINKHHASHIAFDKEFTTNILEESYRFIEYYKIYLDKDVSISFFEYIDEIKEVLEKKSPEAHFALFATLKLSYSLLTACDYYATNEYMADMKVDDFGVLDPKLKKKIIANFESNKVYNKQLFENFDKLLNKPFSELQERNRENLNFLRQKLNAEVISTLRDNPDNKWYYIEAPTGSGKTNLSLASIAELLKTDQSLNKVFYVFPFTTLITQTFQGIQETIGLNNNEIIQLHSKAGFHKKEAENDGIYGKEKRLYLDNLFVNYPFCVTSHVNFFEILKGNSKETNYIHHRLCNSIVIIDELQTYNPKHWDKILFFIENYAQLFNIRFIIMSATLPKIDALSKTNKGKFINLTPNKKEYFSNRNFAGRVEFNFSLLDNENFKNIEKSEYISQLSEFVIQQAEEYYTKYRKARVLIEFITKNTASKFFKLIRLNKNYEGYKLFIISGDILEPRRKIIIKELKEEKYDKVIVVSTQVVEAGVDIDMDLGFKDRSLLDSDEQLAGRINRNASKNDCKVFLFKCDNAVTIYGKDKRYQQQQKNKELYFGFKEILQNKSFDKLYEKVFEDALKPDWTDGDKFDNYIDNFRRFDLKNITNEFKLIEDNQSEQLFIPIEIEIEDQDIDFLKSFDLLTPEVKISGEKLFDYYIEIIENKKPDFIQKQIELKKLIGLMSLFTISVYPKMIKILACEFDMEKSKYGYRYLAHWESKYELETGFNLENIDKDIFL